MNTSQPLRISLTGAAPSLRAPEEAPPAGLLAATGEALAAAAAGAFPDEGDAAFVRMAAAADGEGVERFGNGF
jgi:hypothetical protein